jgi:peptidoglycan hydrolase FlgJ
MNRVDLAGTAQATAAAPLPNPRLVSAAHEFEASLMKEFLKPLQHDSLFAEDGKDGEDGGSDAALMDYGTEMMAKAISEHGGFGIARTILNHFKASGEHAAANRNDEGTHF